MELDYAEIYCLDEELDQLDGTPEERLGVFAVPTEHDKVMVARQNARVHYLLEDRSANEYLEDDF